MQLSLFEPVTLLIFLDIFLKSYIFAALKNKIIGSLLDFIHSRLKYMFTLLVNRYHWLFEVNVDLESKISIDSHQILVK